MVEQGRYEGRGDANVIEQKSKGREYTKREGENKEEGGEEGGERKINIKPLCSFLFKMYKSA